MSFLGFGRGDNAVRPLQYTVYQRPGENIPEADRTHLFGHDGSQNLESLFADEQARAYMQTMQTYGLNSREGKSARDQLNRRMDWELGARLPPHANWAIDQRGQIGYQVLDINNDYVYPIATLAAAAGLGLGAASAAGAFGGAAPAAAGTTTGVGAGNGIGLTGGLGFQAGITAPAATVPTAATGATAGLSFGAPAVAGTTASGAATGAAALPVAGSAGIGSAGIGTGGMSFLPGAATSGAGAGTSATGAGAGLTMGGTGGGAATTAGGLSPFWSKMIGDNASGVGQGLMSMWGASKSGQTRLNKARAAILEKLAAEYDRTSPARQNLERQYDSRLPEYMQLNRTGLKGNFDYPIFPG